MQSSMFYDFALSSDGSSAVSGHHGGKVKWWDLRSKDSEQAEIEISNSPVSSIYLSRDETQVSYLSPNPKPETPI